VVYEEELPLNVRTFSEQELQELSDSIADEYKVSRATMRSVVSCESQWNKTAIGDHGNSYGLVQIHLPSHRSVTEEMATDPEFALRFLAGHLAEGNGNMWTCYRNL